VAARADERKKLERLCRYISRPTVSEKPLSLTPNGNIRYQLKTPYKDGVTHVIFKPLDLMAHIPVRPPCGRPAVVQIGSPADLSSPASRHWCQNQESTSPVAARLPPIASTVLW